jgi:hypothetical protein
VGLDQKEFRTKAPALGAIDLEESKMANSKLKRLIDKREAVNARIKLEQNKMRAGERKSDTRRKVLAGATVLEWAKRDSEFSSRLISELDGFLVRDADRALFGLPPRPTLGHTKAA